jgi:hypothetical protein
MKTKKVQKEIGAAAACMAALVFFFLLFFFSFYRGLWKM